MKNTSSAFDACLVDIRECAAGTCVLTSDLRRAGMQQTHSAHIMNVFLGSTSPVYTVLLVSRRYLSSSSCQRPTHPLSHQIVLSVRHWTDTLFSFTCTRDPSFSFDSGQFAMVGLDINNATVDPGSWAEVETFTSSTSMSR